MDKTTPEIPAWAVRHRDEEEIGLAMAELYDPWPLHPAPTSGLEWFGESLAGLTDMGTAFDLVNMVGRAASRAGIGGVDPDTLGEANYLLMGLAGGTVLPVIRFRSIVGGDHASDPVQ